VHSSAAGDGAARAFRLWGHFAADLLCGTVVAAIAVALYPPPAALALTVPTALVAVVVACWLAMRQHDRSLCEHCVAALPLDAAERAARCRLRFRLAHAGNEPRLLVPYLAGLALVNFAPGPAGRVVWMLAQLTLVYLLRCTVTHRRLQPWCPWCRGGGQEDPASTDPLPDDDRQLA
jgi:hypothetical protein